MDHSTGGTPVLSWPPKVGPLFWCQREGITILVRKIYRPESVFWFDQKPNSNRSSAKRLAYLGRWTRKPELRAISRLMVDLLRLRSAAIWHCFSPSFNDAEIWYRAPSTARLKEAESVSSSLQPQQGTGSCASNVNLGEKLWSEIYQSDKRALTYLAKTAEIRVT